MKIVHLTDTHLGLRQWHYTDEQGRNARERDIYAAFVAAVDKILELKPSAVIHAGDLFDSYQPPAAALGVVLDQAVRLRSAGIEFAVIAGNHSTPRTTAVDHPFTLLERFGIHAVHTESRQVRFGELLITAIPHCDDKEQMAQWITEARPDPAARFNVLSTHIGFGGLGYIGFSEAGSIELSGEILKSVSAFDYIALGDVHEFDRPKINAVYAGSLEPLTWADKATFKGIVEIDLTADPRQDSFLALHDIKGRRHIQLPAIDASEFSNLTEAICATAQRYDIAGAVVRLPINNAALEVFGAIDRRKIGAAFADCLHLELDPLFNSIRPNAAPPQDLRNFLVQHTPKNIDTTMFVERAQFYMTKASEELGA